MKRTAVLFLLVAFVFVAFAGEAGHVAAQKGSTSFSYAHVAGNPTGAPTAVQIDALPGTLHTVTFNNWQGLAGSLVTVLSDTAGPCTTSSPANIAVISPIQSTTPTPASLEYDLAFHNGLCFYSFGSSFDVTITYQ